MRSDRHRQAIASLRVNAKSLAAEGKAIRREIQKCGRDTETADYLRFHRASRVRPEARVTHLALAAVRGVPYAAVEQKCRIVPPLSQVRKKIFFRHWPFASSEEKCAVDKWLREAREYLEKTREFRTGKCPVVA